MKLYHCRDARSLRPLWALEEMGIDCELELLPFPPRIFQKSFLGINPLGTVPYFVDGDTRMTESCAICHYLVDRYGPREFGVRPEEPDYGAFLNWLYHADATLTFPQAVVLRYTRLEPESRKLPQAADDYRAFFLGRLRLLEAWLPGREYLCADRFTIADICIGYALYLGSLPMIGISGEYQPHTRDYLARLMERPAFQRAANVGKPMAFG